MEILYVHVRMYILQKMKRYCTCTIYGTYKSSMYVLQENQFDQDWLIAYERQMIV